MSADARLFGRVLRNAGWSSASVLISIGSGIVQMAVLARLLGPPGLGTLGLLVAATAVFGSVLRVNSAEAVITFVSRDLARDRGAAGRTAGFFYKVDFASSFVALGGLLAFAALSGERLGISRENAYLFAAYGLTLLPLSTYWVSHALLRVADRFRWTVYQSTLHAVVEAGGCLALFAMQARLEQVVWFLVAVAAFDGALAFGLAGAALRRAGIPLRLAVRGGPPEGALRFILLGHGRGIVKTLSRSLDVLCVGTWAGPHQVGLYRAAKQVTDQVQVPGQALVSSLYPEYSRLWFGGRRRELRRLVARSCGVLLAVGVVAVGIVWWQGDTVIRLLLGEPFLAARPALLILIGSAVALLVLSPVYALPAAIGRPGISLFAAAVAMAAQLLALWRLVPVYGVLGAAWASVVFVGVWGLVLLVPVLPLLAAPPADPVPPELVPGSA
ncbi:MAG TPA: lipopolysaccharide biosynthesis protein [Longimicrobiaceae bacterium]|nr:lipopolysaccharide biosynthesis protein [Longimicrobiaceae bacterium]